MKKFLFTLLFCTLPLIASAQMGGAFGSSGGGSSTLDMSTLLPIIADSTLWHLQGADTLVTDGALPVKVSGLRVSGTTRLDGTLTMVTAAAEQVRLGTGSDAAPELSSAGDTNTGVRFHGSDITTFVQGGTEKTRIDPNGINVGATTTPKAKLQVTATGISAADYYKGIRLSNPDAATVGVQAFSPALVLRGAGWKTDATAGSDSVLVGIYVWPVQGSTAPFGRLMIDYKIGTGSWTNYALLQMGGTMTIAGNYATTYNNPSFSGSAGSASFSSEDDLYICMDNNNDDADTKSVIFYKNGAFGFANASEVGRINESGYLGLGTGTYTYAMIDVNNGNVWSKPLFRLGRDKKLNIPADIDSSVISVTGSGKIAFSKSLADTAADFNVQTNIARWDSSYAHCEASNVADTGEITLASGAEGFGEVKIGAEYAHFYFESDGTVTLISNTANVSTTNDVDAKLNIYDGGTSVIIENQLGSTLKCLVKVTYMIP